MQTSDKYKLHEIGITIASTGGGCTAYTDAEYYYMIGSKEHECSAPEDFENEPIIVTLWDSQSDSDPVLEYDSMASFLNAYIEYHAKGGNKTFKDFMNRDDGSNEHEKNVITQNKTQFVYIVETFEHSAHVGVYDSIELIRSLFDNMYLHQDGYDNWMLFDHENRDDLDGDETPEDIDEILEDLEPDYVIHEHQLIK